MRHFTLVFLLIFSLLSCKDFSKNSTVNTQNNKQLTIYYLIRHAEKLSGKNPDLTEKGKQRAQSWAQYFRDDSLTAVYSTDTQRTLATALPTAEEFGLTIQKYDPTQLVDKTFKSNTVGKRILIVGHTDTTPMIANALLGEKKYDDIPMSEFGWVYMITVRNGEAHCEIKTYNSPKNLDEGPP